MHYSFFVRTDGKFERICFTEILCLEAAKNYVNIRTTTHNLLVHIPLKQIEKELPANLFCRIHRSYIVAIDKITSFDNNYVWLGKLQLHLSAAFIDQLKSKLLIVENDKHNLLHSIKHLTSIRV